MVRFVVIVLALSFLACGDSGFPNGAPTSAEVRLGSPVVYLRSGRSASVRISVAGDREGATFRVELARLPAGVTFEELELASGVESALVLQASASAPAAAADARVVARSGGAVGEADLQVEVIDARPGQLDLGFGTTGAVRVPVDGPLLVNDLVVLPDQTVVGAAIRWTGEREEGLVFGLAADGTPLPALGVGGVVPTGDFLPWTAAVHPGGALWLGGATTSAPGHYRPAVARLIGSQLDAPVELPGVENGWLLALEVTETGLKAAGSTSGTTILAELDPDGQPIPARPVVDYGYPALSAAFVRGGVLTCNADRLLHYTREQVTPFFLDSQSVWDFFTLLALPNDRFLVGGRAAGWAGVARLSSLDGEVDSTFGIDGSGIAAWGHDDLQSVVLDLARTTNGIAALSYGEGQGAVELVHLDAAGDLDSAIGDGGFVEVLRLPPPEMSLPAARLAVDAADRAVVCADDDGELVCVRAFL